MDSLQRTPNPSVPPFPWVSESSTDVSSYPADFLVGERTQAVQTSTPRLSFRVVCMVRDLDIDHYRGLGLRERVQELARETSSPSLSPGLPWQWEQDYLRLIGSDLLDVWSVAPSLPISLSFSARMLTEIPLPHFRVDLLPTTRPEATRPSSLHQAASDEPDPVAIAATVKRVLQITDQQVKDITGIGKSTLHNWRHKKSKPRASTLDPLLRLFALARLVVDKVGPAEAALWFRSGSPSPLSLLLRGDLASVEHAVADQLFADLPLQREAHEAFAPDVDIDVEAPPLTTPLRRSRRPPRRVKLPPQ